MKTIKIILFIFLIILSEFTWAYDFSAVHEGQTIYYNITSDTEPYTVEVTFQNSNYEEAFYTDFPNGSLIIPDYVMHNGKNYTITAIAPYAFYECDSLTEISMGNYIALIDYDAFYKCSRLNVINIPHTVKRIGEGAFQHCSGITSMHIPDSIQTIEYFAFLYCTKLKTFTVGKNNLHFTVLDDILYNHTMDTLIACPTAKYGEITIPNTVTWIDPAAFLACENLMGILKIPNSVKYIVDNAFDGCKHFNALILGDSVKYIGNNAFTGCSGLQGNLFIPNSVNFLGLGAFRYCSGLTAVNIPDSITTVFHYTFFKCESLKTVSFGKNLSIINAFAFQDCAGLKEISIPNSVKYINDGAFTHCSGLESLSIGDSVTHISQFAFSYCSNLRSITLGESMQYIGHNAFMNDQNLKEINIKAKIPPTILRLTFNNVPDSVSIYVPCNSKILYEADTLWNKFTHIQEADFTYKISVNTNNPLRGSAHATNADCITHQTILTALANPFCEFVEWNDGNTDNPRTVTLTQDTTFTAIFNTQTGYYEITVLSNDSFLGNVSGSGIFQEGSLITLKATREPLYFSRFKEWNDGNTDNPRSIRVTQDSVFTAVFINISNNVESINKGILSIYPNPSSTQLTLDNGQEIILEMQIYDVSGKQVKRGRMHDTKQSIDISDLHTGMYFVKVKTEKGVVNRKIQVLR